MTGPRSKAERRRRTWAYQGNAQVFEVVVRPAGLETLRHPNRVMEQRRSRRRRRRRLLWTAGPNLPMSNPSNRPRPPP